MTFLPLFLFVVAGVVPLLLPVQAEGFEKPLEAVIDDVESAASLDENHAEHPKSHGGGDEEAVGGQAEGIGGAKEEEEAKRRQR